MICRMCQRMAHVSTKFVTWTPFCVSDPGGWTLGSWISIQLPQWSPFQAYHKAIWGIQPLIISKPWSCLATSLKPEHCGRTSHLWSSIRSVCMNPEPKMPKRTSRLDHSTNFKMLRACQALVFFSINFPCSCFSSKYRLSGAKFSSTHRSQV